MKFIHLSDLHLGKRVNGFSMIEEQRYILREILAIAGQEMPEGVLIAGDVYDRTVPPVEAVELLGDFLKGLADLGCRVILISGNHDSPERLSFASPLIAESGVYISPACHGDIAPVSFQDGFGEVRVYPLPFVKPVSMRAVYPEETIVSYTDAVRAAVGHMELDTSKRNILVTHQFVTGAKTCESEELSVGGADQVDASLFDAFDYVALGHIHGPQHVGRESIRYCGTPLKYSFSESAHQKSLTIAEFFEKGKLEIRTVPLKPLHDMRELRGSYEEITSRKNYEGTAVDDYVHITLTDEEDILDAAAKLRIIYPNLMKMDYDNRRTREQKEVEEPEEAGEKQPLKLLREFFEQQNNQPMDEKQTELAAELIEGLWGQEGL